MTAQPAARARRAHKVHKATRSPLLLTVTIPPVSSPKYLTGQYVICLKWDVFGLTHNLMSDFRANYTLCGNGMEKTELGKNAPPKS